MVATQLTNWIVLKKVQIKKRDAVSVGNQGEKQSMAKSPHGLVSVKSLWHVGTCPFSNLQLVRQVHIPGPPVIRMLATSEYAHGTHVLLTHSEPHPVLCWAVLPGP